MIYTAFKNGVAGARCLLLVMAATASVFAAGPRKRISTTEIGTGIQTYSANAISVSPDGSWLAFMGRSGQGYIDLKSGKLVNAKVGWWLISYEMPRTAFSPADGSLAMMIYREGKSALGVWPVGVKPDQVPGKEVMPFPRRVYPKTPVTWSPDGKTIYMVVGRDLPWQKMPPSEDNPPTQNENVVLALAGSYKPDKTRNRFEKLYPGAYAQEKRSFIMAIDVASGKVGMLARGNDVQYLAVSPDGRRLAAVQIKGKLDDKDEAERANQLFGDVYLMDSAPVADLPQIDLEKTDDIKAGWFDHEGRRLEPVLTNVGMNSTDGFVGFPTRMGTNGNPQLAWSPNSSSFAYASVGQLNDGDVFVYDIASRKLRNLTEKVKLSTSPKQFGYRYNLYQYNSPKFGDIYNPLWLDDGSALVVVGEGDVWLVPVAQGSEPRNLTKQFNHETVRIVPDTSLTRAASDQPRTITIITKDRETRTDSVWKLNVDTGKAGLVADTGVFINRTVVVDGKSENLYFTGQTFNSATNVYRLSIGGSAPSQSPRTAQALTNFKRELADRIFPEYRILKWRTAGGYLGYGLLYLPEGITPAHKAPLIFEAYPGSFGSTVDERGRKGMHFFDKPLERRLDNGFAVLLADVPMSDFGVYEHTMQQMLDGVNAATDAAVATGLIDESRMGITGASYGGLMVYTVVTHTDRFKAAVASAGYSDVIAEYAGGKNSLAYQTTGQGRLAVRFWDDPQRYLENAPFTSLNQVKTPLLIVHGDQDPVVAVWNAHENFRGLDYLKKPAILAAYRRLGHFVEQDDEVNLRIVGWFREHLLGDKAVTQKANQGGEFIGGRIPGDRLATPYVPPASDK